MINTNLALKNYDHIFYVHIPLRSKTMTSFIDKTSFEKSRGSPLWSPPPPQIYMTLFILKSFHFAVTKPLPFMPVTSFKAHPLI